MIGIVFSIIRCTNKCANKVYSLSSKDYDGNIEYKFNRLS